MCANGEEGGVKFARLHGFLNVVDLAVELNFDAHVDDALHFGFQDVARQTVARDAEAHHAAEHRAGVMNRDAVAEAAQVIGGRHAGRASADDQNVLAGFFFRAFELPATLDCLVAQKTLD